MTETTHENPRLAEARQAAEEYEAEHVTDDAASAIIFDRLGDVMDETGISQDDALAILAAADRLAGEGGADPAQIFSRSNLKQMALALKGGQVPQTPDSGVAPVPATAPGPATYEPGEYERLVEEKRAILAAGKAGEPGALNAYEEFQRQHPDIKVRGNTHRATVDRWTPQAEPVQVDPQRVAEYQRRREEIRQAAGASRIGREDAGVALSLLKQEYPDVAGRRR
jgi:hypothetical protein